MNAINSTVIFSIIIDFAKFGKHTYTHIHWNFATNEIFASMPGDKSSVANKNVMYYSSENKSFN